MLKRSLRHDICSIYVDEYSLPGVILFHERNMLVGGGMKYHCRTVLRKNLGQPGLILDVPYRECHRQTGKPCSEFLLYSVEREFVQFEKYEPPRVELGDLPAQFRSDRAASTGNQHGFRFQQAMQSFIVEYHRISAEEVLRLDTSYLGNRDLSADQVVVGGDGQRLDSGGRAQLKHAAPVSVH